MLIDHALRYVAKGLPVFPCCYPDSQGNCGCGRGHTGKSVGKVPLTTNGLTDATTDKEQIKAWWAKTPRANIAIAIPTGYFVLDCDIEHNGFDSLAKMQNDLDFDHTLTWLVTTGTGGQHYWYKTNQTIRNTTMLGGYEGLDIRGLGGYCVAPPSRHRNGLRYETSPVWDGEITMAPPKLIALCLKPIDTGRQRQTPIDTNRHYQEGQRNDRLARDAGSMRRRGLSEQAIYAALMITNQEQCDPPLSEKEVKDISKSIGKYPPEDLSPQTKFKGLI